MWQTLRELVVYRILHVDDSPHRIALGVAVALFVTWTPTIGFQMIIAVALATLVGANKAVTIPIVWISNPLTAVPLYYTNWCLGYMVRRGSLEFDPTVRETLARLVSRKGSVLAHARNLFDAEWWRELIGLIGQCGVDLWIGGLIIGLALGAVSYPVCRWGVGAYRRSRHHDQGAWLHDPLSVADKDVTPNESAEHADSETRA